MSIHSDFSQQRLFGIDFDVLTMQDAVNWVLQNVATGRQSHCRYVVTPNVNLTLRHQNDPEFRRLIHHADLTICDGQPLVRLSKFFRKPLPERVAGSDLVFQTFDAAIPEMPLKVFLLGAAPGVAETAEVNIHNRWDGVQVVGLLSPDFGFEKDPQQNKEIVDQINESGADLLIIGLGAPKQETWAFQHRFELQTAVALCVGGTIDFLAGEQTRAPKIVQRMGVEWVWRIATNPGRLAGRYFKDMVRLPSLILDQMSNLCPGYESDLGVGGAFHEEVVTATHSADQHPDAPRTESKDSVAPVLSSPTPLKNFSYSTETAFTKASTNNAEMTGDDDDSEPCILAFPTAVQRQSGESSDS